MKKTLKVSTVILIIIAISCLIYKKSPQEKPNINIKQPIDNITKKPKREMCRMQRERGKMKLQRAEGAGRLLLAMGQNRAFLNSKQVNLI